MRPAILNPYVVALRCRDKIIATRVLQRAGVPVPQTFVAAEVGRLAPLLSSGGFGIKPYRETGGHGVVVVRKPEDLAGVGYTEGPVFAQRYHEPDGRDRKMYFIGDDVFGVKRVWPPKTYGDKLGEPISVTPALRELVLRCGHAFEMDLFDVDEIVSGCRPYVVDISSFPGFKGVPDAPVRLAGLIHSTCIKALSAGSPMPSPRVPA